MATETPVKERSVPKPEFTDAEAGAKEFPSSHSRSFNYFTPRKRRATVYEDVTVDVQPDPERHLTQGWVYAFADGRAGYPQEWTALKSSNWHEFLDPNEEWEQTIYRNNANIVRQISRTSRTAHGARFPAMNRGWVKVLERHVFAWAHAEHGIGMHVYMPAQRDAPTNMINNALAVGAAHKLRFAQDLILYNLELTEEIEGFDGSAHKEAWQEDPIWQPTRENVEQPHRHPRLGGGVLRHGGGLRAARGRAVPQRASSCRPRRCTATSSRRRSWAPASPTPPASSAARAPCSACSPTTRRTAAENQATMQGWLAEYRRGPSNGGAQLQPIWSQLSEKVVRFEDSFERSRRRFESLLGDLGLETPKEVSA